MQNVYQNVDVRQTDRRIDGQHHAFHKMELLCNFTKKLINTKYFNNIKQQ